MGGLSINLVKPCNNLNPVTCLKVDKIKMKNGYIRLNRSQISIGFMSGVLGNDVLIDK